MAPQRVSWDNRQRRTPQSFTSGSCRLWRGQKSHFLFPLSCGHSTMAIYNSLASTLGGTVVVASRDAIHADDTFYNAITCRRCHFPH
jgi:hypothetical protein